MAAKKRTRKAAQVKDLKPRKAAASKVKGGIATADLLGPVRSRIQQIPPDRG